MLKVYIGQKPGGLGKPDAWFDIEMDKELLLTDFAKNAIKVIDKSTVLGKNVIESPIFGGIPPMQLSTGVKNVILAKFHPEFVINWVYMGRNCLPFLMDIANESDIEVSAGCYYDPYSYGYKGDIEILNDGSIVHGTTEFAIAYLENGGN